VALGALLFVAQGLWSRFDERAPGSRSERTIRITPGQIEELREGFARQMRRPPEARELDRLIANLVDEEILYREAVAQGLPELDGGVQTRLIQKMLFLEGGQAIEDPAALLARAVELELHRDDVVVRRILVQKMRLIGMTLEPGEEPTAPEIAERYESRRASLREPDRVDLVHVFLSVDRRPGSALEDARLLRRRLVEESIGPDGGVAFGDPFPLGHRLDDRSARDLQRSFGARFGEQVFEAPVGGWSSPIDSAYGQHLVWVESIRPGPIPALESVRDRLRRELEQERRQARLEALLSALRTRYEVVREGNETSASRASPASTTG